MRCRNQHNGKGYLWVKSLPLLRPTSHICQHVFSLVSPLKSCITSADRKAGSSQRLCTIYPLTHKICHFKESSYPGEGSSGPYLHKPWLSLLATTQILNLLKNNSNPFQIPWLWCCGPQSQSPVVRLLWESGGVFSCYLFLILFKNHLFSKIWDSSGGQGQRERVNQN